MKWIKQGLIYKVKKDKKWNLSHAQVPTALKIDKNRVRIYYCTRDFRNRSLTSYIDSDSANPKNILYEHNRPILELSDIGNFDDSGIMPTWFLKHKNKIYFYYIGWNVGTSARYRVAHGLAISEDNGKTFKRISTGPILDRSIIDPISVSNHCILIENGIWKMWYMSYIKWERIYNVVEPFYIIKYAESKDGIKWNPTGQICINLDKGEGGIARPFVIKENDIYRMWYSCRKAYDYRNNKKNSYRIGYAESTDGIHWTRKDEQVGIDVSPDGWDSEMIAYPFIYKQKGKLYMLYNGNGFGKSGFGYAILKG